VEFKRIRVLSELPGLRRTIEDGAQIQRQRGRGEWFLQERDARIQHSLMDAAFSV